MKSKLLITTLLLGFAAFSGTTVSDYASAASSDMKTDAQRKKYLEEQKRKIDKQAEDKADRVRDGQKGMANSGASHNRIEEIERERDAKKKALDDHYKKGAQHDVVGLDGKRKNATPTPGKTPQGGVVGLDGKRKVSPGTTNTAPQYVVGVDGKRKLRNP